jgi:hypothetical protein
VHSDPQSDSLAAMTKSSSKFDQVCVLTYKSQLLLTPGIPVLVLETSFIVLTILSRCTRFPPRIQQYIKDFFKDYPPVAGGASAAPIPLDTPGSAFGDPSVPTAVNPFADDDDHLGFEGGLAGASLSAGAKQHYDPPASYDDGNDDGAATLTGTSAARTDAKEASDDGQLGGPPPDDAPPECAAVAAWRVAFAQGLQDKADAERRGKAERAEAAREALVAMNRRWVAQCNAAHDSNMIREKELLRDRDGIIARMSKPGEPPAWNVVPELVDMSGKFKEGARDTSRMRQVLLKLKTHN